MTIKIYKIIMNLGFILIGAFSALLLCMCYYGELLKYQDINRILKTTSQKQYDSNSYNCVNFSEEAVSKLQQEGVGSNVIVIKNVNSDGTHAVVSVWLDPQTNSFVPKTEYLGDYQALKNIYGWANR